MYPYVFDISSFRVQYKAIEIHNYRIKGLSKALIDKPLNIYKIQSNQDLHLSRLHTSHARVTYIVCVSVSLRVGARHISRQDHVAFRFAWWRATCQISKLASSSFGHLTNHIFLLPRTARLLYFTFLPYQPTMNTMQNPTQQRQQPLSLSDALSSLSAAGNSDLPVRRMPNSMRDRKEQRVFLKSVIDQAMEVIADADDRFSEGDWSLEKVEEENCHSQNQ
jgi:hypothetical protein